MCNYIRLSILTNKLKLYTLAYNLKNHQMLQFNYQDRALTPLIFKTITWIRLETSIIQSIGQKTRF